MCLEILAVIVHHPAWATIALPISSWQYTQRKFLKVRKKMIVSSVLIVVALATGCCLQSSTSGTPVLGQQVVLRKDVNITISDGISQTLPKGAVVKVRNIEADTLTIQSIFGINVIKKADCLSAHELEQHIAAIFKKPAARRFENESDLILAAHAGILHEIPMSSKASEYLRALNQWRTFYELVDREQHSRFAGRKKPDFAREEFGFGAIGDFQFSYLSAMRSPLTVQEIINGLRARHSSHPMIEDWALLLQVASACGDAYVNDEEETRLATVTMAAHKRDPRSTIPLFMLLWSDRNAAHSSAIDTPMESNPNYVAGKARLERVKTLDPFDAKAAYYEIALRQLVTLREWQQNRKKTPKTAPALYQSILEQLGTHPLDTDLLVEWENCENRFVSASVCDALDRSKISARILPFVRQSDQLHSSGYETPWPLLAGNLACTESEFEARLACCHDPFTALLPNPDRDEVCSYALRPFSPLRVMDSDNTHKMTKRPHVELNLDWQFSLIDVNLRHLDQGRWSIIRPIHEVPEYWLKIVEQSQKYIKEERIELLFDFDYVRVDTEEERMVSEVALREHIELGRRYKDMLEAMGREVARKKGVPYEPPAVQPANEIQPISRNESLGEKIMREGKMMDRYLALKMGFVPKTALVAKLSDTYGIKSDENLVAQLAPLVEQELMIELKVTERALRARVSEQATRPTEEELVDHKLYLQDLKRLNSEGSVAAMNSARRAIVLHIKAGRHFDPMAAYTLERDAIAIGKVNAKNLSIRLIKRVQRYIPHLNEIDTSRIKNASAQFENFVRQL